MTNAVGIVVIGRNEGARLTTCLRSLLQGPIPKSRIIYVDSGSVDGSPEVAAEIGVLVARLSPDRPFSAARGRNLGFATLMERYPDLDYIQFLDGDCTLAESWIPTGAAFLDQRRDVAIVCGKLREKAPETSLYKRLSEMEWDGPVGEIAGCGGIFLVRAIAFVEVRGFDESIAAGEEPEMCMRLHACGWSVWRVPDEMATHDAAMTTFAQWWRRCARTGFGNCQVVWSHRRSMISVETRPLTSAIFWGGALPALICAASALHPAFVALTLLYPTQIFRIAWGRGVRKGNSWRYGFYMLVAKFAELEGMVKFALMKARNRGDLNCIRPGRNTNT